MCALVVAVSATANAADSTELEREFDRLSGSRDERAEARDALTAMGTWVVPMLIERVEDPRFAVRWEIVNLLGRTRDPRGVEALVARALEDNNSHVRWRAIWALKMIDDASIPDQLAVRLGEPGTGRWRAAVALSMFNDHRALPLLTEKISSPDQWIRWEAINGLGRVHDEGSSSELLALLEHPNVRTRQELAMVLARIGDEAAVRGLIRGLDDPSPQVRWRAAMGLGRLGGPQARRALAGRLEHEGNARVREQLVRAR